MPYYKFKENAILNNTLETFPDVQFDINANKVYLNNINEWKMIFAESKSYIW